jgi:enoyl-CoA hydratase/carnithine racemase
MNDDDIQSHLADGVLRLTLNRPRKRNALTAAMYASSRTAGCRKSTQ